MTGRYERRNPRGARRAASERTGLLYPVDCATCGRHLPQGTRGTVINRHNGGRDCAACAERDL